MTIELTRKGFAPSRTTFIVEQIVGVIERSHPYEIMDTGTPHAAILFVHGLIEVEETYAEVLERIARARNTPFAIEVKV